MIGSGASGMSAAVTAAAHGLKVLVVEKEPKFGGTTARSGGWLWIPGTSLAKAWGIHEDPDLARTYLRHEAGNSFDAERVDAFIEHGPKAVDFFITQDRGAVRHAARCFPTTTRRRRAGRKAAARWWRVRSTGASWATTSRISGAALPELTVFGMMLGSGKEIVHFMRATRSVQSAVYVAKRLSKHFLQVLRHGRGMIADERQRARRTPGEVGVRSRHPAVAVLPGQGVDRRERARSEAPWSSATGKRSASTRARGVVLACGGFPHDVARRKELFPHAPTGNEHFSPGPTGNTGDGLRLAEAVGGKLDTSIPHAAAWVPVSVTTRKDGIEGRDAALHRPRQARRHRRHGRRQALHQRRQLVPRLRAGHGRGVRRPSQRSRHS